MALNRQSTDTHYHVKNCRAYVTIIIHIGANIEFELYQYVYGHITNGPVRIYITGTPISPAKNSRATIYRWSVCVWTMRLRTHNERRLRTNEGKPSMQAETVHSYRDRSKYAGALEARMVNALPTIRTCAVYRFRRIYINPSAHRKRQFQNFNAIEMKLIKQFFRPCTSRNLMTMQNKHLFLTLQWRIQNLLKPGAEFSVHARIHIDMVLIFPLNMQYIMTREISNLFFIHGHNSYTYPGATTPAKLKGKCTFIKKSYRSWRWHRLAMSSWIDPIKSALI